MPNKVFRRATNIEPIWFVLVDAKDQEIRFDCNPEMAAGVIMNFAEFTGAGEDETVADRNIIRTVHELFDAAVVEDQHDSFWALINDRRAGIGVNTLIEVASWLAEQYTARPTGPSSPTGQDGTSTGNALTPGASSGVSVYSKSGPVTAVT